MATKIKRVKFGNGGAVLELQLNGVKVGIAKANYTSATQRTWEGEGEVHMASGAVVSIKKEGIFSAVKISDELAQLVDKAIEAGDSLDQRYAIVPKIPGQKGNKKLTPEERRAAAFTLVKGAVQCKDADEATLTFTKVTVANPDILEGVVNKLKRLGYEYTDAKGTWTLSDVRTAREAAEAEEKAANAKKREQRKLEKEQEQKEKEQRKNERLQKTQQAAADRNAAIQQAAAGLQQPATGAQDSQ